MIAKEGFIFIFIGLVFTAGFLFGAVRYDNKLFLVTSIIFSLLTIFTIFFFRDPDRTIPEGDELIVSPADGKVIGIDTLDYNEFIGGKTVKLSIFLSVFDVHVNRVPTSGTIDYVKYNPGAFFAAFEDKASDKNEQTEFGMTNLSGQKIIFKQIAGLIARRIVYKLEEGQTVSAGERFGLIRFGSRAEVFLSTDAELSVKVGDVVDGGSSVIARLTKKIVEEEITEDKGDNVEL